MQKGYIAVVLGALGAAAAGFYFLRKSEPGWAKTIREGITITSGGIVLTWKFIGTGKGPNETYNKSANYTCWAVNGGKDLQAHVEIWQDADGVLSVVGIYGMNLEVTCDFPSLTVSPTDWGFRIS